MKKITRHIFSLLFFLCVGCGNVCFAQTAEELITQIKTAKADTSKVITIDKLVRKLINRGEYDKAKSYALEAVSLSEKLKYSNGKASAENNLGVLFYSQSNYPKALEYWLSALKIYESPGKSALKEQGAATCNTNIGNVYFSQSDFKKALEYYFKSVKIYKEMASSQDGYIASLGKRSSADTYINTGSVYLKLKEPDTALHYFSKALTNYSEINNARGIAISYGSIGEVYREKKEYSSALSYFLKDLKLSEKINDEQDVAVSYINMGEIYKLQANYNEAKKNYLKGLSITKAIGDPEGERLCCEGLAKAFSETGNYKEALQYHLKFKQLTDSIFNSDNLQQLSDLKTTFEVEKKETELKLKSEAEKEKIQALANESRKKQQTVIWFSVFGLAAVIIFSGFILRSLRKTKKQKKIIEGQKTTVDGAYKDLHEKNKEVMDSIFYARRIQRALITNEKYIEKKLNQLNP